MTRRLLFGSSRRTRSRSRQSGFSLVEAMIATGIFAMIAVLLFGALWSGHAQLARMSRTVGEDEQLLTARRILQSWIEATTVAGLAPTRIPGQPPQDGDPVFIGEQSAFVFHATPAERDGTSGLYRIEVAIERRGEGARSDVSIRRQRIDVLSGKPTGELQSARLLSLARPLAFAFADEPGTAVDGIGQRWSDVWDDPMRLPTRIQLSDGRAPLLTVPVGISKDPRCVVLRGVDATANGECTVR